MSGITNYQWILQKRPDGLVKRSDFEFRESTLPALQDGECLVKMLYMALDPATRGYISESGGYLEPLPLGGPVQGVTIGKVVESRNPEVPTGLVVAGLGHWAKYMIVDPTQISAVRVGAMGVLAAMDVSSGFDLPMYLHALGTSGGTGYHGIANVGQIRPGDKVLVSGAAGSVGSIATQVAKLKGAAKVVGIAGGAEKCAEAIRDFGCDSCIDYRATTDMSAAIKKEFPEGLDIYFDNVGGSILEAALDNLAKGARVLICGMISQYNDTTPTPGPRNLWNLLVHTASIQGFLVSDWFGTPSCEAAYGEIAQWLREGRLNAKLDVRTDFENVPDVFNQLFTGGNHGRLVMKVPE